MDYRNIYQVLLDVIGEKTEIPEDMILISPAGDMTKREEVMKRLLSVTGNSLAEEDMGFKRIQTYVQWLKDEYPSLKEVEFSEKEYIRKSLFREATTGYHLLFWVFRMYDALYGNDRFLKELVKDFAPIIKNEKGEDSINPWFNDFVSGYMSKPTLGMNGYSYTASWLFGCNAITQTILTRFGTSFWNAVYPHFDWFSPRTDGQVKSDINFFCNELVYNNGNEVSRYLPIFVAFGHKVSFVFDGHMYRIDFPFADMEMEDITVFKDDEEFKKVDFLDDLFSKKLFENDTKTLGEIFDSSTNISIKIA